MPPILANLDPTGTLARAVNGERIVYDRDGAAIGIDWENIVRDWGVR